MTDQQKLNEILSLLSFLQTHIKTYVKVSFNDLTFELEALMLDYLNVFEKDDEKYVNMNPIQHNYPAIDLVNKRKDIAIQVTTNANLTKVRKTVTTFQKHNLKYSKLIVLGFISSTKESLPNVEVYDVNYLVDLAKYGSSEQKDAIYDILQRRIPLNSLHPLEDKICFDVVYSVINRSAIRDRTACEGNFDDMLKGVSEIKEIITTGRIRGKSIRAKSLVEYTGPIKLKLEDIEFDVSSIIQICNRNKIARSSNFLCLDHSDQKAIDDLKENIIIKTNQLANHFHLNKNIVGSPK